MRRSAGGPVALARLGVAALALALGAGFAGLGGVTSVLRLAVGPSRLT